MGFKVPKDAPEWVMPDRRTTEAIEQAAKLQRQIDEAMGGATGRMLLDLQIEQQHQQRQIDNVTGGATGRMLLETIEQAAKLQRQIDEAMGVASGRATVEAYDLQAKRQQMFEELGFKQVPDFRQIPAIVDCQRGEERRRLRMAEEEGEARARAEFKTRQELEAAHQKELQATAVNLPPPAPAPESISDRNARWLAIFDQEERRKPNGAQTKTCQQVSESEGVKFWTVKAALQRAKKERAERIRQGGAIPLPKKKGKPKIAANNPFGLATKKR